MTTKVFASWARGARSAAHVGGGERGDEVFVRGVDVGRQQLVGDTVVLDRGARVLGDQLDQALEERRGDELTRAAG